MLRLSTFTLLLVVVNRYGAQEAVPVLPQYFSPVPLSTPLRDHRHSSSNSMEKNFFLPDREKWDSTNASYEHPRYPRETRSNCRSLRTSCDDWADKENCFTPEVSYYYKKSRKEAIISCPQKTKNQRLITSNNDTLASGMGLQKVATCKRGYNKKMWKAKNANGVQVEFDTIHCVTNT